MAEKKFLTIDGNEAAAYVAFRCSEVIAIYPITPSSNMGEYSDEWAAKGQKNLWGTIPTVYEMQSEGGAAGAVHGALQTGALTTTFTASQGLLLKIPNMYKISGELTPTVFNISARTLANHALSIFGDHSDINAARQTGFAMMASNSVQEVMDLETISWASTLRSRIPFLHFFDGFRTSHEVQKIEVLPDETIKAMISEELVSAHRKRAMNPDNPFIRGTAQNPDVFFQNRETINTYYNACPDIVQEEMDKFAALTGRQYNLFDYVGDPNAENILVVMASGADASHDTVEYLVKNSGEKIGLVKVHLYRPFSVKHFIQALPKTTKKIAVLDRTKEPGATGEPMYLDVVDSIFKSYQDGTYHFDQMPKVYGGRYGLSSKEFTPSMIKSVFDNLKLDNPKNNFVVGIKDDILNSSLDFDPHFSIESDKVVRSMFWGLGSDGTVGANKNSIKIIGENTDFYCQGYFEYDSKKSGSITISHLRFGPNLIRSPYKVSHANFVACHQTVFLEKYDVIRNLINGGVFLLNTPVPTAEVWNSLPKSQQKQIIDRKIKVYAIDAQTVAENSGMGRRINTVMQTCFFAISGVLPKEQAIEEIKKSIKKTYGKKGENIVQMNLAAVDSTLANLHEVPVPAEVTSDWDTFPTMAPGASEFVANVEGAILGGKGDDLPTSVFPHDGTWPTGTAAFEKRNIALQIPVWDEELCIQCGKCAMVCPHATIRIKSYAPELLSSAPAAFKHTPTKDKDYKGEEYTIQVAAEDCTGCSVCVEVCPVIDKVNPGRKALNMEPQLPLRNQERENWNFFLSIPDKNRDDIKVTNLRQQQLQLPLFEFSGACSGCGETPYVKLMSQLFGNRAVIANATGCSSIYGGNLPTTPWTKDADGRGPAWNNSLFEDNAEFGLGMRLSIDKQAEIARMLLKKMEMEIGMELVQEILDAQQVTEQEINAQRARVEKAKASIAMYNTEDANRLKDLADYLVKKSVWIVGGDGWAYDIGYGGLDHVLASGKNVNILVLDTEVYSNTGGQMSKASPIGAIAKFAAGGKPTRKKDLGMMAMSYGNVYVASVAFGSNDNQTLKAFVEAEAYDGPSIIIAYSHCIAHGINMEAPLQNQKAIVDSGQWILYRYNPNLAVEGKNPFVLESKPPKMPVANYMDMEIRYKMLSKINPTAYTELYKQAQEFVDERYKHYAFLATKENV
ncbi:MAG: pyruvate:ferredoxin (flavodoxin) oxidoreductase [Ignavibacteria bacterium GWF2_33_9]|nr:MAG: pyruvate:ferredoxin (flavodoxin) oxidoreductase [Ignavibacteria bacterium GWF2_33_9]